MNIYVLRHAQSVANQMKLVCGSRDFPLSEIGQEQAIKIQEHLSSFNFDKIYCSPLKRAVSTILNFKSKNVVYEQSIKELDTGDYSEMILEKLWNYNACFRTPWLFPDLRYKNGETFREMTDRIGTWFKEEKKKWNQNDNILIVGHEGTLRTIYMVLNEFSLDDYPDFDIKNCDYLEFYIDNNQTKFNHFKFSLLEKGF